MDGDHRPMDADAFEGRHRSERSVLRGRWASHECCRPQSATVALHGRVVQLLGAAGFGRDAQ